MMFHPGHQFMNCEAVRLPLGLSGASYSLMRSASSGLTLKVFSGEGCIALIKKAITRTTMITRMMLKGVKMVCVCGGDGAV